MILARGESIEAIDLTTLTVRQVAERVLAGPTGSADGSTVVYLDRARTVHILDGAARERGTFTPRLRTDQLFVSATGEQIGAIGDRLLAVHDRTGALHSQMPLSPLDEEMAVRLRGPDVWTASTHGVIRHYQDGRLIASQPSHLSDVEDLRIAGDHAISLGYDRTVVVQRADAKQLVLDEAPCNAGAVLVAGLGVGYVCEDGRQHVYLGRRQLGIITDSVLRDAIREPRSGRVALAASAITVLEADGRVLATAPADAAEALAFEDAQHLLAVRGDGRAVWRLDLAHGAWTQVATLPDKAMAIAVGVGGMVLGTRSSLQLWRDGRELHRVPVSSQVDALAASGDGRYVSANLGDGSTIILDARTGEVDRRLEPVDALGVAAALDEPGDLAVRTSRGTLTIWERATGDSLVWNLEFLRGAFAAVFDAEGRLELSSMDQYLVDIPRETRPVAAILRAIECRVPLRVVGTRLEAAPTNCGPR